MHIKSMVLDGFKSYGQRTEIHGFDREFNAITGLNGTGKSNILDAICFVLGITNLSQVRAGSLQDLIYKSGQGGVVKGTVSITFDNRNQQNSPPGFETFEEITITRQVILGGKNKYMINGSVVTNKRVQDLFCSIQLNVNNPHFLIMQGRITKVINMKPPEVLAMIEEAAGTRMYEVKRQAAVKLLEKKEDKLNELNTVIKEEIQPKMDKLREERERYLEYERTERILENMKRLYEAYRYVHSQKSLTSAEESLHAMQDKVKEIQDTIEENKSTMSDIEKEVKELSNTLEQATGGRLHELDLKVKQKEKIEANANAAQKSAKEAIAAEEKKMKSLQKNIAEDEAAVLTKRKELEKMQGLFQKLKDDDEADAQAFAASQRRYEAVSAGMEVNEEGEAETLQEQLMAAKEAGTQATTEIKQATMQINHFQSLLKQKQKDLGTNTSDYEKDKAELDRMQHNVSKLRHSLSRLNFSENELIALQNQRRTLANELRVLNERIESFEDRNQCVNFRYRDPETNFDRNQVKGTICRLIKLRQREANVAIETAAGGRLYNVVVNTEETSKKLLKYGNLQYRTTFIPLNKIKGNKIPYNVTKIAQDLVGEENVQPALDLVQYDPRLETAMEYTFGNVFICRDLNVARQIAFHARIMRKCVTLEGDVVDPSGVLSGGAPQRGQSILMQIEEMSRYEEQAREKDNELRMVEQEIQQMSMHKEQYLKQKQDFDVRQHELGLLNQRMQHNTHHQQRQEIETLKNDIDRLTKRIKECHEIESKTNLKVKELEGKMKDTKGYREKQLKEAEDEMKRLKGKADASRKKWKEREQDYQTLNLEISELAKGLENSNHQVATCQEVLAKLEEQYDERKRVAIEAKQEAARIHSEYKAEKSAISAKNKDIQKKIHHKEKLGEQNSEYELKLKELSHEIKKLQDDYKKSQMAEAELRKKIKKDDRRLKDAQNLSEKEVGDLTSNIKKTEEKRTKLGRLVNAKARTLFDGEEKLFNELLKKKRVVETDKKKILQIMIDLDNKKEQAIILAHEQVTKDFGSIFGSLLPGGNAKLEPPPGKTVLDGLEVKICLGGVWKESLAELSGGQRSLVALSLILAMLLFKPAPLYILDEVDAALDLSHTQNIGNMLKTHFKQSQFIIVSLKDGMFSNANVLFRTKFVDGMSAVTRTVNKRA